MQLLAERAGTLASAPTLCRWENAVDRASMWRMAGVLVEAFIASFKEPPGELVLDFDATDDLVHGKGSPTANTAVGVPSAANQFRVLLSAAAYVLVEHLRRVGLVGTELAKAQTGPPIPMNRDWGPLTRIRLDLFKIGARVAVSAPAGSCCTWPAAGAPKADSSALGAPTRTRPSWTPPPDA